MYLNMYIVGAMALLVVTLLWVANRHQHERSETGDFVRYPRPMRTNIMIICGNCSGESIIPYKTFMDVHGYCEICGGKSYVLASLRGLLNRRIRGMRIRAISSSPRVLAFEKRRTA